MFFELNYDIIYRFKQKEMASTLEEVLALAQGTHALSQEQLSRILALAPTMGAADLEKLKGMIEGVRTAEENDMKTKLAVYQKAAAAQEEWKAGIARKERQTAEAPELLQDAAQADALISKI